MELDGHETRCFVGWLKIGRLLRKEYVDNDGSDLIMPECYIEKV